MMSVETKLNQGLTVGVLIEQLKQMPLHAVAGFVVGYGDRCNTQQFLPVTEVRELETNETIAETGYSASELCLREVKDTGDLVDSLSVVVVLQ